MYRVFKNKLLVSIMTSRIEFAVEKWSADEKLDLVLFTKIIVCGLFKIISRLYLLKVSVFIEKKCDQ